MSGTSSFEVRIGDGPNTMRQNVNWIWITRPLLVDKLWKRKAAERVSSKERRVMQGIFHGVILWTISDDAIDSAQQASMVTGPWAGSSAPFWSPS
jgi:hypothetical protein